MKISARNQLQGTIQNIQEGAVNGVVTIGLHDTQIKADITMDAIKSLGLAVGGSAYVIIKASSVMFAKAGISGISARNQIAGKIASVEKGAVNGIVTLEIPCGCKIKGSITNEAIDQLGLSEGADAVAVVKATDVMVAVD